MTTAFDVSPNRVMFPNPPLRYSTHICAVVKSPLVCIETKSSKQHYNNNCHYVANNDYKRITFSSPRLIIIRFVFEWRVCVRICESSTARAVVAWICHCSNRSFAFIPLRAITTWNVFEVYRNYTAPFYRPTLVEWC